MAYATSSDFTARFGTDLSTDLVSPDSGAGVIDALLAQASSFIDGYLTKYTVPITGSLSLAILKPHCLNIVAKWLPQRRFAGPFDTTIEDEYSRTMRWLEAHPVLPDATIATSSETNDASETYEFDDPVFNRSNDWGAY